MIPELSQDIGRGELLVEIRENLERFLRLVLPKKDVVLRGGHVLALAEHGLDLVERAESLVVLALLEVEVDKGEIDVIFLGIVLQQIFVGRDGQIVLSCQ